MAAEQPLAIFYHPDGYDTVERPLMGRRAAGKSFLNAWIDRRGADMLHCYARGPREFERFCAIARSRGAKGDARFIPEERPELLSEVGALYFPGPDIGQHAWRRYRRAPTGWSIVGVTHTICTQAVMDGVSEWSRAPIEPWDAVICTSQAVRNSLARQLAAEREFLASRLGATRFSEPCLPIIPLGADTADFAPDADRRERARAALGVGEDEMAALFVGRLSTHGKAHPSPMFIALERAAALSKRRVHLLLAGWFANDAERDFFRDAARHWCPNVQVHLVDGRDDKKRGDAWRASDVFVSLVDNIQETFGLTPVEAMAAGLPAVVSDWDGYRDTVRHGIDGFRVPTLAPPGPFGDDLVDRYAANIDSYDLYMARAAALVVVDVDFAATALARLFADPALRARMGAAGLARARACFDWRVVIDAYAKLLEELAAARKAAPPAPPGRWPARLSPFDMFTTYPSRLPGGMDRARVTAADPAGAIAAVAAVAAAERRVLGPPETLAPRLNRLVAAIAARGEARLRDLLAGEPPARHRRLVADMLTLAKFGVIAIHPETGQNNPREGPSDPAPGA